MPKKYSIKCYHPEGDSVISFDGLEGIWQFLYEDVD